MPAVRVPSGASRSRQPRSMPTRSPTASAKPSLAISESIANLPMAAGHEREEIHLSDPRRASILARAPSSLDFDNGPCPGSIIERVGELSRRLSVHIEQRLAAIDFVAKPNGHLNACRLCFRSSSELGEPGELAVVDMYDTPGAPRSQRMDI